MRNPFLQVAVGISLALGLVACKGGNQAANSNAATQPATQPSAPAAAPAGSTAAGQASMGTQVQLTALNNSGVTGTATLTPKGDSLEVAVNVNGLPDGAGAYPSHIHQGTCASPGAVVQPLNDVQADSAGVGSATTTVAMSVLQQGQHLVMVHRKDGTMASCGEIPANLGSSSM